MLTEDLAIAVAGATKPCPLCNGAYQFEPDMVCPDCDKGRVFILGEGAWRACKGLQPLYPRLSGHDNSCCAGRGWLPTFLLEPEQCVGVGYWGGGWEEHQTDPKEEDYCCDGSGQIQRVDEERLRMLMEEAGYFIEYDTTARWCVSTSQTPFYDALTLLEACAAALEVKP